MDTKVDTMKNFTSVVVFAATKSRKRNKIETDAYFYISYSNPVSVLQIKFG